MARQRVAVQVNQFVGGILTDTNPLNFPSEASSDEQNMVINRDGSRSRRLGFSLETSYTEVDTGISSRVNKSLGRSQFRWKRPGGIESREFLVVQIGNYLGVHDLDGETISGSLVYSTTLLNSKYDVNFSYASVNGKLIVASNSKNILLLDYDGSTVSEDSFRLKVRDFWGLEANPGGVTTTIAENVQRRPKAYGKRHIYNLRNQTYALPRVTETVGLNTVIDPIEAFYSESGDTRYPSNADSAVSFIYADANNSANRTVDRYFASDNYLTKPATTPAPKGYFIIDALSRGASREEAEASLRSDNTELTLIGGIQNEDITPGGAKVVEEYAGRVWYAGFSGQINDGDSKSPSMSNYILFSQLVESTEDVGQCYQEADPTSIDDPALVDTDGGFIRIDEVSEIKSMVNLGTALFVFADNGVWLIRGADGDSFTPTAFTVKRLNNDGCISSGSVVLAQNSIMYWGDSSIFAVVQDQASGDWIVQDAALDKIRGLYEGISEDEKYSCIGYYDQDNTSIRWLYADEPLGQTSAKELVFHTKFGAYTKYLTNTADSDVQGISSVSGGKQIDLSDYREDVEVNSIIVTVNGLDVTMTETPTSRSAEESFYCVIVSNTSTMTYSFGGYSDTSNIDFQRMGNLTNSAYIQTGPITAQEPRLRKDVPYLTTFFERTETSEIEADNSSCKLRAKWDWTNSSAAYKWSNSREAYRPQSRQNGQTMVVTRNKIRGHGKAVSFLFESEGNKDMHIYGWSFNLESTSEE